MSGLSFTLGDRIGKGSFATVFKGRLNRSGETVAVKVVQRAHLKRDKRLLDNFEAEMAILKQMKHPHIVLLNDVAQTQTDFYLVMEYCSLGDLSFFIRKRTQLVKTLPLVASLLDTYPSSACGGLNETIVRHFLAQLAEALKFLRQVDLVHRDIKPQNMLLMPPLDQDQAAAQGIAGLWNLPVLKVADFGFARFLPSTSMAETLCGSPLYMAPEILHYEKYNAKADLWSVGAVAFEMVSSKPPFPATNHMDLIKKIDEAKDVLSFPAGADISDSLRNLIESLLKRSPSERISFEDFFAHDALNVSGKDCSLDLSNLDNQMFISEYLKPHKSNSQEKTDNKLQTVTEELSNLQINKKLYDSNPFSSSDSLLESNLKLKKEPPKDAASPNGVLASSIDNDYVVVEKRTVEVNALADDLAANPATRDLAARRGQNPHPRRRLSSISYGTSPTNALAQALIKSSARLFGAKVDSGTISIPKSVDLAYSSSYRSRDSTEDRLLQDLDGLNRMGRVIALLAEVKQSQLPAADESVDPTVQDLLAQESLALYCRALSVFARAMELAATWWNNHQDDTAPTPTVVNNIVQTIRDQFNDCIEKAEVARKHILNGQSSGLPATSVEKLLFERALELARSAASQELSDDLQSCEMNYGTALWLLRAIKDGDGEALNDDDHELVERLSTRIQQRILALRRRIEGSQTLATSRPSISPARTS